MNKITIAKNISKYFFNPGIKQSYCMNKTNRVFQNYLIKKPKQMPFLTSRLVYYNSNQNQNNKNPEDPKNPKNQKDGWKQLFSEKIKVLNQYIDIVINKKVSVAAIAIGILVGALLYLLSLENQTQQISITQFINLLQTNCFKEVVFVEQQFFLSKNIRSKRVQGKINNQTFFTYVNNFENIYSIITKNGNVKYRNQIKSGMQFSLQKFFILVDTFSIIIIIGILISSAKSGGSGMGQLNTAKNKKFSVTDNVKIKFSDVAGLHEVKRQVQEVVDFLNKPKNYNSLGASIPKGVLLTGPPGTGKTLLAKACAGQANVPFYSVSGSDFVQMFVGVGASRVRQLFKEAKSSNKKAIIFIDELDAIGKKRMNKLGGNDERQSTLNQLLVEMDGFGTSDNVIVMGATNRKQILDNALVRPGRFDRQIQVGLPDLKGRFQIFKVHLRPLKLSSKYTVDDYAKRLASLTPGFSGAEIANLCNQAAILSARQGKQVVQMIDFEISSERVIGGVQRKGFVSMEEKKTVAYHECGHAVVSWFLQGADPLLKVTIIPRSKGALGFAQYFINENQLKTRQQILDRICFILGGRCSEQHFFNEVTTGAYDDLGKAYELAYSLIAKYGMGSEIGYISYPDVKYTKPYGETIESNIDNQIRKIILQCTERTKKLVALHENNIKMLAQQLLVKETLDVLSIQKIIGKRPFPPNKTFQAYLQTSQTS